MSFHFHQQLHDIEHRLGAWMTRDEDFAEHPDNPAEFESKTRTFMCFLENVFGRFYDFKARISDYDDIPDAYGADWERFKTDVCAAVSTSRPFNGICAVMHIQTGVEGNAYVIQNIGIRPCAIEQSFMRVLLKHMALSLPDRMRLVVKIFGIRMEFMNTVIANLKEENPAFVEPTRSKQDRLTAMGRKAVVEGGRVMQVDVLTFESASALKTIKVPWNSSKDPAFPTAERLNNSSKANPLRVKLIRRMIGLAQEGFGQYLNRAKDMTNYLPDALQLDENNLWVYKNGGKVGFQPEERRFFVRDHGAMYYEVCLGAKGDKYVDQIESVQGGSKTVRMELMGGRFVFFLLPKDFVRKGVPNKQTVALTDRASVERIMKAIVLDGENVVGIDANGIVLSNKKALGRMEMVVWSPPTSPLSKKEIQKDHGF